MSGEGVGETETLASDADLADLVRVIEQEDAGEDRVAPLLARHPDDPRLHFMLGSLLAGQGRPIEAHRAMSRAIELAPEFALARYQLGFFEMTSGEPSRALSTWGPLLAGPPDDHLRVFVEGMTHLIRDEFALAIERFEAGLRLNRDNEPMNRDIRLLIAECRKLQDGGSPAEDSDDLSATALLLGGVGGSRTVQ